jgi:hypothetical protein
MTSRTSCDHPETKIEQLSPPRGPHKARHVCVKCGKHVKWASTKTAEERLSEQVRNQYYASQNVNLKKSNQ